MSVNVVLVAREPLFGFFFFFFNGFPDSSTLIFLSLTLLLIVESWKRSILDFFPTLSLFFFSFLGESMMTAGFDGFKTLENVGFIRWMKGILWKGNPGRNLFVRIYKCVQKSQRPSFSFVCFANRPSSNSDTDGCRNRNTIYASVQQ